MMMEAILNAASVPVERRPAVSALLQAYEQTVASEWPMWLRLVLPPSVVAPLLVATARQESNYDPSAEGDDGASVGLLQFNSVNNALVESSPPGSWRLVPSLQGVAAARYVRRAVEANPLSWLAYIARSPYAAFRVMWRYGTDAVHIGKDHLAGLAPGHESVGAAVWAAIRQYFLIALVARLALYSLVVSGGLFLASVVFAGLFGRRKRRKGRR